MATYRKRCGKWQARVTRKGYETLSKTFVSKKDAQYWARGIESNIDKGAYKNLRYAQKVTFKDLIDRFINEVTPSMRGAAADTYRLRAIAKRPISQLSMTELTPTQLATYRDKRLKVIAPNTMLRELSYFSCIINHARREWGLNIDNPVSMIKKPPMPDGRSRVLTEDEKSRIIDVIQKAKPANTNIWLPAIIEFALATAMRLGEITSLLWKDIDFNNRTAFLPITKNGSCRYVPLSNTAIKILNQLPRNHPRVFPFVNGSVSIAFTRYSRKAGVKEVRFHDLRHTAITAMSGRLTNVIELSSVTGHRSLSMLKRYIHLNISDLARKLDD
jgi:integrase